MGLGVPQMTRVFHRLRALGVDIDPSVFTVEQAKAYASGFTKNSFSVMRAFGLTGRNPGETEREMIERWFGE